MFIDTVSTYGCHLCCCWVTSHVAASAFDASAAAVPAATHVLLSGCCYRAMDRSEKEDRMKRAEQKRKEDEARRRYVISTSTCVPTSLTAMIVQA